MNVRVRFAPSPTGFLHIGGLRSALYNYLFARKHHGVFLLRIEDTDRERYVEGGTESLITIFDRLGLYYDEGPRLHEGKLQDEGNYGPYIQSLRLDTYKPFVEQLIASGNAYHCFCSNEELAAMRKEQELMKQPTKYNRHCLKLSKEAIEQKLAASEPHTVRLLVPEGKSTFTDLIRGEITIDNSEVDDQVLLKSDGFPTYHLANVVDDHLMQITHVIRGEEWISSTPKHVILYTLLGWDVPSFAHLPLLLNADRSKLSKRQGDVAVEDYLNKGYLPEALINFVALMGYNPKGDQELYTLPELIPLFEIEKVNPSGAVVNFEKLDWMNGVYLRKKTAAELVELCKPFLDDGNVSVPTELLERILEVEKGRMTRLTDCVELAAAYVTLPSYDPLLLVWKKADAADAKKNLVTVRQLVQNHTPHEWTIPLIEQAIKGYSEAERIPNGNVLWPLRVALSGKSQSAGPFELAWALGQDETLRRLDFAIKRLA